MTIDRKKKILEIIDKVFSAIDFTRSDVHEYMKNISRKVLDKHFLELERRDMIHVVVGGIGKTKVYRRLKGRGLSSIRNRIIDFVKDREEPFTKHDVIAALNPNRKNSIPPVLSQLLNEDVIDKIGTKPRKGHRGRSMYVYARIDEFFGIQPKEPTNILMDNVPEIPSFTTVKDNDCIYDDNAINEIKKTAHRVGLLEGRIEERDASAKEFKNRLDIEISKLKSQHKRAEEAFANTNKVQWTLGKAAGIIDCKVEFEEKLKTQTYIRTVLLAIILIELIVLITCA